MALDINEYWRLVRFKQAELAGASVQYDEDQNPVSAESNGNCRVHVAPIANGRTRVTGIESTVTEAIIVSLKNPDGGKAGVFSEVSLENAARAIVERKAREATKEEAERYRGDMQKATDIAKRAAAAAKVQVSVISQDQADALSKPKK